MLILFMLSFFLLHIDINECGASDNCHADATCTNTAGGFSCACKDGYTGNGVTCTGFNFLCHL